MAAVRDEPDGATWGRLLVEAGLALAVAALFVVSCLTIDIDPKERIGQVSGLASIGLRFVLAALVIVGTLVLAANARGGAYFRVTWQYACAAIAGLLGGALAAGSVVALEGTAWGYNAELGDVGMLAKWATGLSTGGEVPASYPPLAVHALAWYAELFGMPAGHAVKHLQIIGAATTAPLAYVSWRLHFRPGWALGIGCVAMLPLVDLYKPYPNIVLIVFVPLLIKLIDLVRRATDDDLRPAIKHGILFGTAFGVLALAYSGWFQWSAPGAVVVLLAVFPWRSGARTAAVLCAVTGVVFGLIVARYVLGILGDADGIKDAFFYFDVRTDPWYVAMWRNDTPGAVGPWPPPGELGGIGVFSIVLFAGFGAAIAYGRARTSVLVVAGLIASCWILRFWYAHQMWDTKLVQLYPRTSAEILYCLLIACGLAVHDGLAARVSASGAPSRCIGAACALLLLFGASSASIADQYMPENVPHDLGTLAWIAHASPPFSTSQARDAMLEASSASAGDAWSKAHVLDGDPGSSYSSAVHPVADREEWLELRLPQSRSFSTLVVRASADGVPEDLVVELWDGTRWIARTAAPVSLAPGGVATVSFGRTEQTNRMRLRATKLGAVPGGFALRLAEIALYR